MAPPPAARAEEVLQLRLVVAEAQEKGVMQAAHYEAMLRGLEEGGRFDRAHYIKLWKGRIDEKEKKRIICSPNQSQNMIKHIYLIRI